jgi:hypothetical protein
MQKARVTILGNVAGHGGGPSSPIKKGPARRPIKDGLAYRRQQRRSRGGEATGRRKSDYCKMGQRKA